MHSMTNRAGPALLAGILVAAGGLGSGAAGAAESQTLPPIRVETDVEVSDTYSAARTSSATRTDTPLIEIPQSVTVVTQELIADQAMQSMADVVRYMPGVVMGQGEGNRDQPTIRGNNTTADFFVDGIRDDVQYFRDLYNIERVEALMGPNAMIFGRGGGGGVINRVTKQADWNERREVTLQVGSHERLRGTLDVNLPVNDVFAFRLNGLYEDSDSYRDFVTLERQAINPAVALSFGERTSLRLGFEHFSDERTADRGIPSFGGRPLEVDASTFFGDPDLSFSDAEVNVLSALLEHETAGGVTIRNRTRYADYDKFYQNVFPRGLSASGGEIEITAYNNATERENLFNQTDVIWSFQSGGVEHTLLAGMELGRQTTDNFRNTGFFNDTDTIFPTPLSSPRISVPVTFRQSSTDADNHIEVDLAAVYVQDQIRISPRWLAVLGLRYDSFDLDFRNNRTGQTLGRDDDLVSPRAGLVFQPLPTVSLYGSYSVSYLPSAGDQFASLTDVSRALEPEEFENYEIGAKWAVRDDLVLTAAVYRLDRTNTSARDPNDPDRIVQTGRQRTRGAEFTVSGAITPVWHIMGGYAWQDAEITSETTAAQAGATVPLTPRHSLSLWSRYDLNPMWGFGVGVIHQDEMYAGIDNAVTLPDFTRVDAALFLKVNERVRAQLNVENLFDEDYHLTAHNNNNITPGSPIAVRLTLSATL